MSELKIGTGLPTNSEPTVADVARAAEELGFESVWAPDLIIGDGTPALEAALALASAAAVTERAGIGFSVLTVPLRPVAWLAVQIGTLQRLSGDRVLLGVGSGGFPGSPFWRALGVPPGERGARTDAALRALPRLLSGAPTSLEPDAPPLTLDPAAMPPVLVGGNSAVAMRRAVEHGGWFPSLIAPDDLRSAVAKLRTMAGKRGRPAPTVTVGGHLFLGDDTAARDARNGFVGDLIRTHGMPPETAEKIPMTARNMDELAEVFAAYADAGADRVVTGPDNGDRLDGLAMMRDAHALLSSST